MISTADLRRGAALTSDASNLVAAKPKMPTPAARPGPKRGHHVHHMVPKVTKVAAPRPSSPEPSPVLSAAAPASPAPAAAAPTPASELAEAKRMLQGRRVISYRHDPYGYSPIMVVVARNTEAPAAEPQPAAPCKPVLSSAGFALPVPASVAAAAGKSRSKPSAAAQQSATFNNASKNGKDNIMDLSVTEDGVSEVSSETGSFATHGTLPRKLSAKRDSVTCTVPAQSTPFTTSSQPNICSPLEETGLSPDTDAGLPASYTVAAPAAPAPLRAPSVIRYASVDFRFGSAWFIAPFKTCEGDLVVVEYPSNHSLHMGLVSAITTVKPSTFYSAKNPNPDTLTEDELAVLPRLLRHARDFDKETKLDLRSHDMRSLQSAKYLAEDMNVPIQFLDAEWLLDLSAVTYLVNVYGDQVELVDQLADALATAEGAEVVFSYPAVKQYY